ncbi:MAG TPA: IS110 family transposase, partial [Thiobacillus sp.]
MIESWKIFLQSQGAAIENGTVLHYGDPAAERAAAADSTIVADLSQLGVIAFRGEDTVTFLQGQLTNDVRSLHADAAQWSGYCSPKGRLLGNFLMWRQGEDYCLQLSGDILPGVLKRLSMFILRAKVHGLMKASFVPPPAIRELRDLTRYRRKLVESQSAERNRLLKVLETANIKLASVASDVFGVSGQLMVAALVAGEATPAAMAELAKGRLREKLPQLELALEGKVEEHHRYLLRLQLKRLQAVEEDLAQLEAHLQQRLEPYREQEARLREIPGVDGTLAAIIIAELGVDMSVFPSASKIAAWAGVSPGNHESAGKRRSGRVTKGNVYLKTALVEAALAASRKKGSYLREKFFRLKARRGYKRAAVAVAHKILTAVYHMLDQQVPYHELGELKAIHTVAPNGGAGGKFLP